MAGLEAPIHPARVLLHCCCRTFGAPADAVRQHTKTCTQVSCMQRLLYTCSLLAHLGCGLVLGPFTGPALPLGGESLRCNPSCPLLECGPAPVGAEVRCLAICANVAVEEDDTPTRPGLCRREGSSDLRVMEWCLEVLDSSVAPC